MGENNLAKSLKRLIQRRVYSLSGSTAGQYLDLVGNARNRVYIVAGSLNPAFYSGKFVDFIGDAAACAEEEGHILEVKVAYSANNLVDQRKEVEVLPEWKAIFEGQAIEDLKNRNARFLDFLVDHYTVVSGEEPVQLFASTRYMSSHFAVIDDGVYIEELHNPGGPRETDVIKEYPKELARFLMHFKQVIDIDVEKTMHKLPLDQLAAQREDYELTPAP